MQLWPSQSRGVSAVHDALNRGVRRILLTGPTGSGKTELSGEIVRDLLNTDRKASLYTNRRMLLRQTVARFAEMGLDPGIRAAGYEENLHRPFQVSSIQTEMARVGVKWDLHDSDVALIDEAHLLGYEELARRHFSAGKAYVGLTATPVGLEHLYDELIIAGTNSELRGYGALVPARHFDAESPDFLALRKAGKLPAGGDDVSESQAAEAVSPEVIYANVIDWYNKLNPERKPGLGFAPGVKESLWFAERFHEAGISAAHIANDGVWMNGEWLAEGGSKEMDDAKITVEEASRAGRCAVVWNRFMLREGISWNWLEHGIIATIFGGVQTYIQVLGRFLRASPSTGKRFACVQDHGGGRWTHGSINQDWPWKLESTEGSIYQMRADRIRSGLEKEPMRCPKCGMMMNRANCICGFKITSKSRPVRQLDGTLVERTDDFFPEKRIDTTPDHEKAWVSCYYRCMKSGRTFGQAFGLFQKENFGMTPNPGWSHMPKAEVDRYKKIAEVPRDRLT